MPTLYEIIRRPLITEKGLQVKETEGTLVFDVAPEATKTEVKQAVESLFKVKVLKRHEHRDLALLEPALPETEYFELAGSGQIVIEDAPTIALGYPGYGPGDKLNIRSRTVSSLPVKSGVQLIEVTQKIAQGMSGGPLLDVHQNVIGINHKGGPDMARDFAVHINELTAWLAE